MALTLFLFFYFAVNQQNFPLGCIEDENRIRPDYPFFTIPAGRKVETEEVCNYIPSLQSDFIEKIRPLNNAGIFKKDGAVSVKKGKTKVRKFYTTENLSLYPGIILGDNEINDSNSLVLYLKAKSGNGLFLLVLRSNDRIFARQIIIEKNTNCPLKVILPIGDFFEIPYKKGDFPRDSYQMELYMLNYNPVEWILLGFEVK